MLNIIEYMRQKQNYLACLVGTLKEEKTLLFNISYGGIVLTRENKEFSACCCSAVIVLYDIADVQRKRGRQSEKFTLAGRNEAR